MKYALTLVYGFFLFFFMITIHEFGHFITAKILGVKVREFSCGMGPALFKKQKGETLFAFRLLPIGGYCKLEGEDDFEESEDEKDPRSFLNQPYHNKILILISGSFMNLVLCIVIMFFVFLPYKIPFFTNVKLAFAMTGRVIFAVFDGLKLIFSGMAKSDDVMGIVGIAGVVSEEARNGFADVSFLMAMLSGNLAVMNMLPVPALDGGRVFLLIIKWISGGRLSDRTEAIINAVGMVLLMAIMFFLIVKDTINLF